MQQPVPFNIQDQTLWLSAERTIFWEETKSLILADLHFGKSGHFRKAGIGIPQAAFKEDLQHLIALIQFYQPIQIIVVGDFFHSKMNQEIGLFEKWRKDFIELPIHLVKGNHDILEQAWYQENKITVHEERLEIGPFQFIHEPPLNQSTEPTLYCFYGHVHPGISISGTGKQSLRFPCYYFSDHHAILPAFGRFTGLHAIKPKKKDKVFAIVNKTIIPIQ